MFYRHTMRIMIATLIVASAILVLPETTHLAEAHKWDGHTFPTWDHAVDVDIFGGITVTLTITSFTPDDGWHDNRFPWITLPHRFCFPPGVGYDGPDENGCYSLNVCLMTGDGSATVCPQEDDDDDDDASGNNDDTGSNS